MRNALSMEYAAATRSTDLRVRLVQTRLVEVNLMHVQNRTKTIHPKAEAAERRATSLPKPESVMISAVCRSEKGGSPTNVVFVSCVASERF